MLAYVVDNDGVVEDKKAFYVRVKQLDRCWRVIKDVEDPCKQWSSLIYRFSQILI